jgi:hypothetical protein
VIFGKEVVKIYWSGDLAEVLCADNSRFQAQCVLSTVSLGVLKNVCNELFEPEIPEYKLDAIKVSELTFYLSLSHFSFNNCLFSEHRYWNCG